MRKILVAVVALFAPAGMAHAADVNIAVAANFTDAAKEIGAAFAAKSGHKAVFSFGATGQLYTQITQDAPFTVFLSADDTTPAKAAKEGFAVPESVFTYAIGKLVLWGKTKEVTAREEVLKAGAFNKLSLANPKTAPYGAAAIETLTKLGILDAVRPKIVEGQNITQAFQFVDTANAELGFVALSQIIKTTEGTRWEVPENLYTPIRQDAALLKKGASDEGAKAFIAFLKGPEAAAVIKSYGYVVDAK